MNNKKEVESLQQPIERQVEAPKIPEQNLESMSFMEKIEKKFARVPNTTSDVNDDTVVVQPFGSAQGKQPPVTLPINVQQMQVGKTAKTELGIAWLVTWAIRQIKMLTKLGRKVRLQDIPEAKK
ncbi:hypothetical protein COT54_01345 [Candidatus Collierbacteria bacterium CG09_land_8_20_14_0_10_46_12]|uniref:Uncharacterized protein n=1 Tax=Candidatus Collierbacteria bacterium CG09_land_8_20_14_0_10_46_12 TaxID=1974533 RepID=A0A2H0X1L7_9BACT|nr:MAG: hypothetical protein COT54_01345 [Candidatus Collierbacteria bacterium CG09_land_8_20_14_0_10_46_12]